MKLTDTSEDPSLLMKDTAVPSLHFVRQKWTKTQH